MIPSRTFISSHNLTIFNLQPNLIQKEEQETPVPSLYAVPLLVQLVHVVLVGEDAPHALPLPAPPHPPHQVGALGLEAEAAVLLVSADHARERDDDGVQEAKLVAGEEGPFPEHLLETLELGKELLLRCCSSGTLSGC